MEAAPAAGAHVAVARGGEAVAGLRRHLDVVVAGVSGEAVVAIGIGGGGRQLAQLGPQRHGHAGPRTVIAVELAVIGRIVEDRALNNARRWPRLAHGHAVDIANAIGAAVPEEFDGITD